MSDSEHPFKSGDGAYLVDDLRRGHVMVVTSADLAECKHCGLEVTAGQLAQNGMKLQDLEATRCLSHERKNAFIENGFKHE